MAAAPAKAPMPKATSGTRPRTPPATQATIAPTPNQAGHSSRWESVSVEALRQGRAGATAMRNSSARPIGPAMRLK